MMKHGAYNNADNNKAIIDFIGDLTCPWSYLTYARLMRLETTTHHPITIKWRPFECEPTSGSLSSIIHGQDDMHKIQSYLTLIGAQDGAFYNFRNAKLSPKTKNAHRLILWAQDHETLGNADMHQLISSLFQAHFMDGVDISDPQFLTSLTVSLLSVDDFDAGFFDGDDYKNAVDNSTLKYKKMAITTTPSVIINDLDMIAGAHETKLYQSMIETALLK